MKSVVAGGRVYRFVSWEGDEFRADPAADEFASNELDRETPGHSSTEN